LGQRPNSLDHHGRRFPRCVPASEIIRAYIRIRPNVEGPAGVEGVLGTLGDRACVGVRGVAPDAAPDVAPAAAGPDERGEMDLLAGD